MKSHLVSLLAMRHMTSSLSTFAQEHPGDWLIWEPGVVTAAGSDTLPFRSSRAPVSAPGQGEALALQLEPLKRVTLGRLETNDLPINDGTLSSTHLIFHRTPQGVYSVEDAQSRNGSTLNGKVLEAGMLSELKNGDVLTAAQCTFTVMTAEGFLRRLQKA